MVRHEDFVMLSEPGIAEHRKIRQLVMLYGGEGRRRLAYRPDFEDEDGVTPTYFLASEDEWDELDREFIMWFVKRGEMLEAMVPRKVLPVVFEAFTADFRSVLHMTRSQDS